MKRIFFTIVLILILKSVYSQPLNWSWAKSNSGDGHDYSYGICADANGHIYVTGSFQQPSAQFGSTTLNTLPSNNHAMFIACYDSAGNALWSKAATGYGNSEGNCIATDNAGHIYVTGKYKNTGSFYIAGSALVTSGSMEEAFLACYDMNGNGIWSRNCGMVNWGAPNNYSIALNDAGEIYLTGPFDDSTYLIKYTNTGQEIYRKKFTNTSLINTFPWNVAIDNLGNPVVAAYSSQPIVTIDTTTVYNTSNGYNVLLIKSDPNGNVIWANVEGAYYSLYKPDVECDHQGNIYITGYFNGQQAQFGNTTLTNAGLEDIFLAKFDAGGNSVWAKRAGGYHFDESCAMTIDAQDNIYLTGFYRAFTQFGSYTLSNSGDPDLFVAKYESNGNVIWLKNAVGGSVDRGSGITVDPYNRIIISGYFSSPNVTFGSQFIVNSNSSFYPYDMFIACLEQPPFVSDVNEQRKKAVNIYPQPLQTPGMLYFKNIFLSSVPLNLFNSEGQLVYKGTMESGELTLPQLEAGLYFLEYKYAGKIQREKVVIVQ